MASPVCSPQTASRLFHVPAEIRRQIYSHLVETEGIHVTRSKRGEVGLSPCCGCDLDARHSSYDRRVPGSWDGWLRRLASSWGLHWKCEEIALGQGEGANELEESWRLMGAVLQVCHLMRYEVFELIARHACFIITDLKALDALLEASSTPMAQSSRSYSFRDSILTHITQLDIVLRLPLPVFHSFTGTVKTMEGASSTDFEEHSRIWSAIPAKISKLQELRKLRIWLDHPDKSFWAVIDERAVLSQFERLATPDKLELIFYIPYVHPKLEDPGRHYIQENSQAHESSLPPFRISRFVRPRHSSEQDDNGEYHLQTIEDFPILYGVMSLEISFEGLAEWERCLWRAGADVGLIRAIARHHCW